MRFSRALVLLVLVSLVATPLVGALRVEAPHAMVPTPHMPLLPPDVSDAYVLYLLARSEGLDVRLLKADVPAAETLDLQALVLKLGARANAPITAADARVFDALHPSVAGVVAQTLWAMDASWELRDRAFAGLTSAQEDELAGYVLAQDFQNPRAIELSLLVNRTQLIESAILLLDALDAIIIPQLVTLRDLQVWPDFAVADPATVLRIGSTGNDYEEMPRILQIDPRGDDHHANNAGATLLGDPLRRPLDVRIAAAVSIDLDGSDVYRRVAQAEHFPAQGAGELGIGIAHDLAGDDHFIAAATFSRAAGDLGIGVLRDHAGNDRYFHGGNGLGRAGGIGILRDDAGDDQYQSGPTASGFGTATGTGILWDRDGTDRYNGTGASATSYGFAIDGGRGWLVDEGPDEDYYASADPAVVGTSTIKHGCNNCRWTAGIRGDALGSAPGGRGNDASGGLAALIHEQWFSG